MDVTELRRAWRFDEAEKAIKEELSGPAVEVELGRIAFQRGRFQLASEHFERALALAPNCETAHAWRVATLSQGRRYAEARAAADAAPDAHLVRLARARVVLAETSDARPLLAAVETILEREPDYLDALEWRIVALGKLSRYDEADMAAEEAIRRHPDAAELPMAWSEVLAEAGRFGDAVEQCERALARQPDYVRAAYDKSKHLRSAGHPDEALAYLEQAVGTRPEVSRLHWGQGIALTDIEDFLGALSQFEKAVALDPDIGNYHLWMAYALRKLARQDEAFDVVRAGRERIPDDVNLVIEEVWCHHEIGDMDTAIAVSAEALAMAPSSSSAIRCHAYTFRKASRFREAETILEAGMDIRPFDASLPHSLGWVHSNQGHYDDAAASFRRAVDLDPNSSSYLASLCAVLRWGYREDDVEQLLTANCARLSDPTVLVMQKALLHEETGRDQDALTLYHQINEKTPRYVTAWVKRIDILRNQRHLVEAEQVAQRAVEVNPFNADLRLALARIHSARNDETSAITVLRTGCTDLPHSTMLGRYLAAFLQSADEFDQAWDVLSHLPDIADVELERVAQRRAAHDYQHAIEIAVAAATRYQHDPRFRAALGDVRSDLDEDKLALAEFEAALRINDANVQALRGKANCLRKLKRYVEAEHFLIAEIAQRPSYSILRLELAWTYGSMERRESGIAQYQQALEIDPRSSRLLRNYADALSLVGRWKEAEHVLGDAVEQFPHDAWLMITKGELCDTLNQREEALTWFDKALALSPRSNWALTAKSATLRSLGRFDEAERLLAPALERKPEFVNVVVEWGWVLRDRGQLTRARQAFERALTLTVGRRDRADVLHCLGWVAFSASDFQQATTHFRTALEKYPDSLDAKIGLAWTLLREGQPNGEAEAEQLCLEVLDRRPRRHLAHTCLGVLYTHQNNLPQAEHHLRRAIEIDPYGGSYVDLGALFVQMDRFEEAESLLRKALDRDWYDTQAHIELGGLYLQRDFDADEAGPDARQAAQHFRQALVIDPSRGAAAIGLSLALTRSPGDLLAAERVLRDALERNDCDQPRWQLLVALARLLIGRGDATQRRDLYLEALSIAQQAIELAVQQADPHYVAGVAAYKAGESGPEAQARPFYRRRALRHFRRCLGHDPRHTEARRVMNLAEQSLAITRTSLVGSVLMMFVATVMLVVMWVGFFLTDKVSTVVISTLTPVLVGLVALGFVLPFLVRLKLPGGVEADLSASLNQVSAGPTGEVSIGPGRLVGRSSDGSGGGSPLSTGPRGELPRLG